MNNNFKTKALYLCDNHKGTASKFRTSSISSDRPHVAILMATYNGRTYLSDQLDSICSQSYTNWSLWVSDDRSTDGTRKVLENFGASHPERKISVQAGPGLGSTANFLGLLCDASIDADFYAICDQDDVWLPDKLSRAIASLKKYEGKPALYGAGTIVVAQNLKPVGRSCRFRRNVEFRNALVQNISGGNTMVLNKAAHLIVINAIPKSLPACHDWWLYQLITGVGGLAIHDDRAALLYRQHDGNQYGTNKGARAGFVRFRNLLNGRYKKWNEINIAALLSVSSFLTKENRATLDQFIELRQMRGIPALRRLRHAGLFRQSRMGQLMLMVAAISGRL